MDENPYRSPEAEAEPARRQHRSASRWVKACLLATLSYALTSFCSTGIRFHPNGPLGYSLGYLVAAGLGIDAPKFTLPGIVVLRACGVAMHVLGWVFVLSLWETRRASA